MGRCKCAETLWRIRHAPLTDEERLLCDYACRRMRGWGPPERLELVQPNRRWWGTPKMHFFERWSNTFHVPRRIGLLLRAMHHAHGLDGVSLVEEDHDRYDFGTRTYATYNDWEDDFYTAPDVARVALDYSDEDVVYRGSPCPWPYTWGNVLRRDAELLRDAAILVRGDGGALPASFWV